MLDVGSIPHDVYLEASPTDLFGDVDAFMESYESGGESQAYAERLEHHLCISDEELRSRVGAGIIPGTV